MLAAMRSWRPPRRRGLAIPLALAFLWNTTACDKAEELAAKASGKEDKDAEKKDDGADGDEKKDDAEKNDDGDEKKPAEAKPEPIKVEALHTGLDLMLSFVPDNDWEYMIIRDASVLEDYYAEGMRFLDKPLEALAGAKSAPPDIRDVNEAYATMQTEGKAVVEALGSSGLRLKDGGAFIRDKKGNALIVFAADDPAAIANLAKALGEDDVEADDCGPAAPSAAPQGPSR